MSYWYGRVVRGEPYTFVPTKTCFSDRCAGELVLGAALVVVQGLCVRETCSFAALLV